jgi:hypothetical protein
MKILTCVDFNTHTNLHELRQKHASESTNSLAFNGMVFCQIDQISGSLRPLPRLP